jgi:eukaryotic-like serine/threonine-protein kinase
MQQYGPYVVTGSGQPGRRSQVYRTLRPALKVDILLRVFTGPSKPAEVAKEMAGLVGLVHPNIVRVLDAGVSGRSAYVALEPWRAELRSILGFKELLATRVGIVEGLCAGLAAAHLMGIRHGDLDANQIRVGGDGRPRIDFSDRPSPSQKGLITGNMALSPEQVRGLPADARSDVFAASYVSYEALTGRRPFERDNAVEMLYAILHEEPRPREAAPDLPVPLADWLLRGLAKDPDRRFQNGDDMWKALPRV